jgi:transcriptional regulator with XRE-family HTH domain
MMKIAPLDPDILGHGDLYIAEWMDWVGINTTELSASSDLSKGYLSALISGNHDKNPTLEALRKVGRAMKLPVWALFLPPPDRGLDAHLIRFTSRLADKRIS